MEWAGSFREVKAPGSSSGSQVRGLDPAADELMAPKLSHWGSLRKEGFQQEVLWGAIQLSQAAIQWLHHLISVQPVVWAWPSWRLAEKSRSGECIQRQGDFTTPLCRGTTPSTSPQGNLLGKTNTPVPLFLQLPFPLFLGGWSKKLAYIGAVKEHCIWLNPPPQLILSPALNHQETGPSCQTWCVFISQCYFCSHRGISSNQPRWSCLCTPAV